MGVRESGAKPDRSRFPNQWCIFLGTSSSGTRVSRPVSEIRLSSRLPGFKTLLKSEGGTPMAIAKTNRGEAHCFELPGRIDQGRGAAMEAQVATSRTKRQATPTPTSRDRPGTRQQLPVRSTPRKRNISKTLLKYTIKFKKKKSQFLKIPPNNYPFSKYGNPIQNPISGWGEKSLHRPDRTLFNSSFLHKHPHQPPYANQAIKDAEKRTRWQRGKSEYRSREDGEILALPSQHLWHRWWPTHSTICTLTAMNSAGIGKSDY